MADFFKGKKILVTGATGSIGSAIVRQLLPYDPAVIRLFSRDEHKHFLMQQEFADQANLRYLLGDVRDLDRLRLALEDIDILFHAAAYKHVPLCEYNSFEAVKTNVIGTQNIITAARECGVKRVLLISSDKAASPPNVMGATKLLAEKLITSTMHTAGPNPILFSSVRFGNVLGSRGSVIPIFREQIRRGGPVTITDPDMLRFFMSLPQAVNLTFAAMEQMQGGELFILKMPVVRLGDLAEVLIEMLAPQYGHEPGSIERHIIGIRPGEKYQEILMTQEESYYAEEADDMFIVRSPLRLPGEDLPEVASREHAAGYSTVDLKPLSKDDLRTLLQEVVETSHSCPA